MRGQPSRALGGQYGCPVAIGAVDGCVVYTGVEVNRGRGVTWGFRWDGPAIELYGPKWPVD